jgi:phage shock protein A
MAESVLMRVRRLVVGQIEGAVDQLERAGGVGVMREAIREVERAIDEVRGEVEAATTRRLQAMRQTRMIGDRVAALEEKARFALSEGRDDLAEAAVAGQLDFEAQARALETAQAEAREQAAQLDEILAQLVARRAAMVEELAAFEAARRDAAALAGASPRGEAGVARRVERAEAAFDRALTGAGGTGLARTEAANAARIAELEALQRSAAIAQRLAALRADG